MAQWIARGFPKAKAAGSNPAEDTERAGVDICVYEPLPDAERAWLVALDRELWPPKDLRSHAQKWLDQREAKPPHPAPRDLLTDAEICRVFTDVTRFGLVVELCGHGMFGDTAVRILDHEIYLGTGPQPILFVAEDNLPASTPKRMGWYVRLFGEKPAKKKEKYAGRGRDDAWKLFTTYATREQNVEWCVKYKLHKPESRTNYDY